MKKIILIVLLAISLFGDSIIVPLTSKHISTKYSYNENNLGLGYKYQLTNEVYVAGGFYKNSIYKTSVFTNIGYDYKIVKHLKIGTEIGGVSGYTKATWLPYIRPTVTLLLYKNTSCRFSYLPKASSKQANVVTLELLIEI